MITASGLHVSRGGRQVLRGVDFAAEAGAITCILGPNGAGKSTLLAALGGLLPVARGEVRIEGEPLLDLPPIERARRVAYVPQRTLLRAALPVATVVSHGRYAHTSGLGEPGPADLRAIERAMAEASVVGLRDRRFDELSAGEARRVLVARALATEAKVLLLDEPTAALDVRHSLELHGMLTRLASAGRCVVVVLHELDVARELAQHAVLLDRGEVVGAAPPAQVITAANVREVYGVDLVKRSALGFRLRSEADDGE